MCTSRLSRRLNERKSWIKKARVAREKRPEGYCLRSGGREEGEMARKLERTRKNRLVKGRGGEREKERTEQW